MSADLYRHLAESCGTPNLCVFPSEDTSAWVTFTLVFFGLITFDMFVLNRNPTALSMTKAVIFTMFWIGCAGMFCVWVYWRPAAGCGAQISPHIYCSPDL